MKEARKGRQWAVALLLRYLIGDPLPQDILERLDSLETNLEKDSENEYRQSR